MILKPFEFLYHILSGAKNVLYDLKVLPTEHLNVAVVSIGNLSFGGTGKTPFIQFVARELKSKKIIVVCRSYKASLDKPQKVDISNSMAAQIFGDEAVLLQKSLPEVSVWSGPSKAATAKACLLESPDLILVDDGFSHRKLARKFDLVLFDAGRMGKDYFRESFSSLKRAQALVFTKIPDESASEILQFKKMIGQRFPHLANSLFESKMVTSLAFSTEFPISVFCGIANPDSFQESLIKAGYQIVHFIRYSDHQEYSNEMQTDILESFKQALRDNPKLKLVTTEKDFVKLNHAELRSVVQVAEYAVTMQSQEKEKLFEKIRQSL